MYFEQIRRLAPSLFVATIVGLGIFSGFYTFSGLGLLINNGVLAVILACVIQLTIASTVIGLPFVGGPPKIVLFMFYLVFLLISSATAYVYIFNQQANAGRASNDELMPVIQLVSDYSTTLKTMEFRSVQEKRTECRRTEARLREEEDLGQRSGFGPGRGPEYARKLLEYKDCKAALEAAELQYNNFLSKSDAITESLARSEDADTLKLLPFQLDDLESYATSRAETKRQAINAYLGDSRSPVERALEPLLKGEVASIGVISSIIWSVLFDSASLLMGLLWLNMQSGNRKFLDAVYDSLRDTLLGLKRLKRLPKDLNDFGAGSELALEDNIHERRKLERFGARVIASCRALAEGERVDPLDPLKAIMRYLKVLNLTDFRSKNEDSPLVGIRSDDVKDNELLESILAILVMDDVFQVNSTLNAYVLNRENEVAFDMIVFLINNPPYLAAREMVRYFPKMTQSARLLTDGKRK